MGKLKNHQLPTDIMAIHSIMPKWTALSKNAQKQRYTHGNQKNPEEMLPLTFLRKTSIMKTFFRNATRTLARPASPVVPCTTSKLTTPCTECWRPPRRKRKGDTTRLHTTTVYWKQRATHSSIHTRIAERGHNSIYHWGFVYTLDEKLDKLNHLPCWREQAQWNGQCVPKQTSHEKHTTSRRPNTSQLCWACATLDVSCFEDTMRRH